MKLMIIPIIFFMALAYAQEAGITIDKFGYGKSGQDVFFTVHNTGSIPITNVEIYVDGEVVRALKGKTSPQKGFEISLLLTPGNHTIEARTSEGAYDSLDIYVSPVQEKEYTPPAHEEIPPTKTKAFKILVILTIITVVILCLSLRRPKLDY